METDRKKFYEEILRAADASEKALVERLVDELIYYEAELENLKQLPFIATNPRYPAIQKVTPAAKLYKDLMAQYMNGIRILLNILRKVETSAQDELLKRLEEFQ